MHFDELHYLTERSIKHDESREFCEPLVEKPIRSRVEPFEVKDKPINEHSEPKTGLERIIGMINDPLKQKSQDIHSLNSLMGKEKKGPRTQKWGTGL